ncbi:MAG: TPM domain-containing protein [Clostridia bacterium]|nr:TPM domain-containing protein [Clostridia bacterium]
MKKCNNRKFRRIALLLSLIALCPVLLGAAPSHTTEFYVNDYADVLSDETEAHILNTALQLDNATTAQVCVLTVDTLDGEDISSYSVEVFREWGIGDKDKDNGVLILLSVNDREMWITSGYGIEGTLTDAKLGSLRDTYAMPYYRENDFDTGTKMLFDAIVSVVATEEYGLEALGDYPLPEVAYYETTEFTEDDLKTMLVFFSSPLLFYGVFTFGQFIKFLRLKKADKINGTNNAFVYQIRCRERRKQLALSLMRIIFMPSRGSSHRGGGGFGGGGFGGGGFRGGGGSTGGGGAGGSF